MSKPTLSELPVPSGAGTDAVRLPGLFHLSALTTLFALSTSRMLRGRKLLWLCLLLALPTVLVLVIQRYVESYDATEVEMAFIFAIFPQALVPLTALVYGSGMVQDELDEQTLTYLFMRPIPRWLIYVVKLLATSLVTALLGSLFCLICQFAVHRFDLKAEALQPANLATLAGLLSLSVFAYCSLFGLFSLLIRRTMVLGMVYLIGFEGVLANLDFVVRKLTIMYYFRVLSVRWLGQVSSEWNIDLKTAPDAMTCVWSLGGASLAFAVVAALLFGSREFRVKTPEGN